MAYGAPDWYRITRHDVVLMVDTFIAPSILPKKVSITDTATMIVDDSTVRRGIILKNHGKSTVYIGTNLVDVDDGYPLDAGEGISIDTLSQIYGICESGQSSEIRYLRVYRT